MRMLKKFNGDIVQWLRGFYHVAASGNFSAAAKLMGINRSAVRHHLHRLEEELDVTLFDRTQEPMRLTSEGMRLLQWTETLFDTVQNMIVDVSRSGTDIQGTVKLFTQQYICLYVLKDIIRRFLNAYPNVSVEIHTGTLGHALRQLESRECDLAVSASPFHMEHYDFTKLFSDRHMLLARKGSFAISPEPSREELEKLPFIGFSAGAAQPTTDELFSAMGISPRRILTVDSDLLALEYVKAGIGVAILREKHYRHEFDSLDGYPMDTVMPPAEIGLLTLKTAYISPVTRLFMNYCAEHIREQHAFDDEETS